MAMIRVTQQYICASEIDGGGDPRMVHVNHPSVYNAIAPLPPFSVAAIAVGGWDIDRIWTLVAYRSRLYG